MSYWAILIVGNGLRIEYSLCFKFLSVTFIY